MNHKNASPAITLQVAVSSLRVVGTVFVLIGLVGCFLATRNLSSRSTESIQIMASTSIFLMAPGVIYHLTAVLIRRHDVTMALLARRTALAQSAAGVVAVCLLLLLPNAQLQVLLGAVPILFFVPALLVQSHEIGKALEALRLLSETQRGFEVMAVLPSIEEAPAKDAFSDGSPAGTKEDSNTAITRPENERV